jgi:hypothetical protein
MLACNPIITNARKSIANIANTIPTAGINIKIPIRIPKSNPTRIEIINILNLFP